MIEEKQEDYFFENFKSNILPFLSKNDDFVVIKKEEWSGFVLSIRNMCEIYATNQNQNNYNFKGDNDEENNYNR